MNSSFRNSDNEICGKGDFQRVKARVNIPLFVKLDDYGKPRVWNATMTVTHGWLGNSGLACELNPSRIINSNVSLSHIRHLSENWMLIASLGAGIYAPTNNVSFKSVLANGGAIFAYNLTDNFSVGLGAGLTNSYGAPMVMPMGYLNWQLKGRVELLLNVSNGVKANVKIKANERLTMDVTPIEFDGMSAVIKHDGKDMLYSMFMIRSLLAVDMDLGKGFSLLGGAGGVLLRNSSIQERKIDNLFSGGDTNKYRLKTTPQFSAGIKYEFKPLYHYYVMKYLIIEDERLAMTELKRMVTRIRPDYECAGWCESVESAVSLLDGDEHKADLVFADIRLTDGVSFEIFDKTGYEGPVIFTTAYDEYALNAFKVNGIDYLLKPIDAQELEAAILKFERIFAGMSEKRETVCRTVKDRFLVRVGDDMLSLAAKDIAFFNSEEGYTYSNTFAGKRYIIDMSIETLADMLDKAVFCRVSRAYICNIEAVARVAKMFGGRLKVITKPDSPNPILVSRERALQVTKWLNGDI